LEDAMERNLEFYAGLAVTLALSFGIMLLVIPS
jgi:hypothetical protein